MSEKNKVIEKEEKRKFDRYLFETDFFDVTPPEEEPEEEVVEEVVITEEDLAQAESRGYTQGLQEGKEQAFEDYNTELKKHADNLAGSLANVAAARKEIELEATTKALALLGEMTDVLLQDARDKYPEALLKEAITATGALSGEQKQGVKIRTSAQTRDYLAENLLKQNTVKGLSEENIITDENLQPGDCVIEWVSGGIDLRLDALAEKVKKALGSAAQSGRQQHEEQQKEADSAASDAETAKQAAKGGEEAPQAPETEDDEAQKSDSDNADNN